MTAADRHQQVMELFDEVCDLSSSDQQAVLNELCGDDPALRHEVESMLHHDDSEAGPVTPFESTRRFEAMVSEMFNDGGDSPLPERIGDYRVIRQIGHGGMGLIYEAEQESPSRRVAVKVLRPQLMSASLLKRFQHEAHVLGQLQHPGIAQIFEADIATTSEGGIPFFVMEYVNGLPLDEYVLKQDPDISARLELMSRVCDAVHHAHQKGIIHRDLKPGNVLVIETDTESGSSSSTGIGSTLHDLIGRPKVLDFGIARATDADVQTVTLQTEAGQLIGTLAYMSPEQVEGDSDALDTRCDVYALGVMLYELVTGTRPHDLKGKSVPEAARMIREVEPRLVGTLVRSLRGDVETIIAKALEKERDRRYGSAAELAADLRRFINHQPIEARPASAIYQLGKFARRNKGFVAGVTIAFAALIVALIITSISLQQARHDRDAAMKAQEETARANEQVEVVAHFQGDMISRVDLRRMGEGLLDQLCEELARNSTDGMSSESINALLAGVNGTNLARGAVERDVLDQAVRAAEEDFADRPELLARLLESIAETYFTLALYDSAIPLYEQVLALRLEHLDQDHKDIAKAYGNLAQALVSTGRRAEAEEHAREALRRREAALPADHGLVLEAMRRMAYALESNGRGEEAQAYMADLVSRYQAQGESAMSQAYTTYNGYAVMLLRSGKIEEAVPYLELAREGLTRTLGPEHSMTLATLNNLARVSSQLGRLDEAATHYKELLGIAERTLGDTDRRTFIILRNYAIVLAKLDRIVEAEATFETLLERQRRHLGEEHDDTKETAARLDALRNPSETNQEGDLEGGSDSS